MQSLRGALSRCRWAPPVCPSPAVSSIKTPDGATSSPWPPTFPADSTRRATTLCWSQVWQASLLNYRNPVSGSALIFWPSWCHVFANILNTAGGWQQQITFQHHVQSLQKFYRMLQNNGFPKDHIKTFFSNGQLSGMMVSLSESQSPKIRTLAGKVKQYKTKKKATRKRSWPPYRLTVMTGTASQPSSSLPQMA